MKGPVPGHMTIASQLLSCVWPFVTPWTAAHQAYLSFNIPWSLLKRESIELLTPPSRLTLCRPFSSRLQSFPESGSFSLSQLFASGAKSIGTSASVLAVTIQDWSPLVLTGLISLQSKSLLQHHSSKTSVLQCSDFFIVQLSHPSWLLEKP